LIKKSSLKKKRPTIANARSKLAALTAESEQTVARLRLLEAAVQQAGDIILITLAETGRSDLEIVFVNPAFSQMTGYTRQEALGKTPRLLRGPHTDKRVLNRLRHSILEGQLFYGETLNYRKDGTEVNIEWSISPVRNETGEIAYFVGIGRDITSCKQIQQEQERLAAIGQLTAGIAHDFNNILTSIIGFAELAGDRPDVPETTQQDLERITQQGRRAARLIRQILDFSRQSVTEKRAIELIPFLNDVLKLLERTIPEDIRLILEIEPGEYTFYADPAQLQRALTNLAINARDAMPGGGVLKFRLSPLTLRPGDTPPYANMPAGDWIALSISDNGLGIPPELQPHLFEPFFTTKAAGQGTGLGLAHVYGIVKQHGGEIGVQSEPGQGATFTLYLPAWSSSPKMLPQADQTETPQGRGEVILLVEDNPSVLEVVKGMLERLNYQVLTATNGQQALEVYHQYEQHVALILTDVTMPELGGVALAHMLHQKHPTLKIVAMTGYPLDAHAKNSLAQSTVTWLQKPLNLHLLAQTIYRALTQ
jgi:PAS domain S-box-containing protein